MKLGTQTASLTNHIYSRMVVGQPKPEVGMGATVLCWTDRHAATITQVWANGVVTVQRDRAIRNDNNGMSECQNCTFEANPNGNKQHFRPTKNGSWHEVTWNPDTKRWNKMEGAGLRIGDRDEYRDYSF